MSSSTVSSSSKKQFLEFGPLEFINRGRVRTEKDRDIHQAEQATQGIRHILISYIHDLSQEMDQLEKRENPSASYETKTNPTLISKFWEWVNGTKRELRLIEAREKAVDYATESLKLWHRIAFISELQAEYTRRAAQLYEVSKNAYDHHIHTTNGWTWWR